MKSSLTVVVHSRQQYQRRQKKLSIRPPVLLSSSSLIIVIMILATLFMTRVNTRFVPSQITSSFVNAQWSVVEAFQVSSSSLTRLRPNTFHGIPRSTIVGHNNRMMSSWFGLGSTTSTATPFETTTTTTATATNTDDDSNTSSLKPPIDTMTGREMKLELESYGISTKSFFEKNEYCTALEKARADGLQQPTQQNDHTNTATAKSTASSSTTNTSSSSSSSSLSREERIRTEMQSCQTMAARDMKQELEHVYGISTRSLFEKSEFVRALAEARVDGITRTTTTSTSKTNNNNSNNNNNNNNNNEGYAEYKDVEVLTDDSSGPRQKGQAPKTQPQQQQVQEPMNPFAGMGGTGGMGGMGGMGGFANLFKTMGGVGNASPFGSGGGNPFGNVGSTDNMMGKMKEMMSNPKVMAIMQKAQSNPRIMQKVQECMSNPTAMLKYQNDPEVAELIRELQPYLK